VSIFSPCLGAQINCAQDCAQVPASSCSNIIRFERGETLRVHFGASFQSRVSGIGVTVGAGRPRPSRLGGPAPKPPNNWASIKPIVADPFGGSTMPTTRFPTLLVLPATLWLAVSLGDENCSITRPGGVKEPGVTNTKGECCSSFYSNSGNWDDCVPPTPGRADGARFYTSVSKH
jgi:hypothetical protein